jgi:hypothetical protein
MPMMSSLFLGISGMVQSRELRYRVIKSIGVS